MKKLFSFLFITCSFVMASAQEMVKLKTIHTDYGRIQGQNIKTIGALDNAVINYDTLPEFVLMPTQVNVSNDTFPVNCTLQQCYEIYFYTSTDSIIFSVGQKSAMNKLMETILPGDTCHLSMLNINIPSIKSHIESNGIEWKNIMYWKLITGFCYSDKEGSYPAKIFYAASDTCTFQVVSGGNAAQNAVKLKTIHTAYGLINGSSFHEIGALDGATIHSDSIPMLATHMHIVNTGNETFKGSDQFRQTIIFYAYSDNDELLIDPDYNESNTYPFVNNLLPGDTAVYGTMGFRFSDIRTAIGEKIWNRISYWKIITGINYTSVDGKIPDSVFFAGADTCTFRIVTGNGVTEFEKIQCRTFPNPATERLHVECNRDIQSLTLYNVTGLQVLRTYPRNSKAQISVSDLPHGMYLLQVQTKDGSSVRKIIVE